MEITKSNYSEIRQENQLLKQIHNTTLFKADKLEKYVKRKNLTTHGVPESTKSQDEGKEVLMAVAKKLNLSTDKQVDIQRAHRLRKKTANPKPRPIIVRFASYKKKETRLCSTNPS